MAVIGFMNDDRKRTDPDQRSPAEGAANQPSEDTPNQPQASQPKASQPQASQPQASQPQASQPNAKPRGGRPRTPKPRPRSRPAAVAGSKPHAKPDRLSSRLRQPHQPGRRKPDPHAAATTDADSIRLHHVHPRTSAPTDGLITLEELDPDPAITLRTAMPGWMVSTLVHVVVLLVLAVYTLPPIPRPQYEHQLVLSECVEPIDDPQLMPLDSVELSEPDSSEPPLEDPNLLESLDEAPLDDLPPDLMLDEPMDLAPHDPALDATGETTAENSQTAPNHSGDSDSKSRSQPPKNRPKPKDATKFYGKNVVGDSFVFLIDNSPSMKGQRIQVALQQVMMAVASMEKRQKFYVICYSDKAYPMFIPEVEMGLLTATSRNKKRLSEWLQTVRLQPPKQTGIKDALKTAFELKPSTICCLTDGDYANIVYDEFYRRDSDSALLVFAIAPPAIRSKMSKGAAERMKKLKTWQRLAESKNGGMQLVPSPSN